MSGPEKKRSDWSFARRAIVFISLCGIGGFLLLTPLFEPPRAHYPGDVPFLLGTATGMLIGLVIHLLLPRE